MQSANFTTRLGIFRIFSGSDNKLTYEIEEAQVREYDRVAVLYYIWAVTQEIKIPAAAKGDKDEVRVYKSRLRVTDTFLRNAGSWQLISSHRSRLPEAKKMM
jgi:hypothetical protein